MAQVNVTIPDLGGSKDVELIEICVAVGDTIAIDDSLVVLETDKATMEIPSTHAGTVVSIGVKEGDTCNQGDLILALETNAQADTDTSADAEVAAPAAEDSTPLAQETSADEASNESEQAQSSAVASVSVQPQILPDIGATDAEIIEILVAVGDTVTEGDALLVLETDKASMEIPTEATGTVVSLKVALGDKLNQGDLLAEIEREIGQTTAAAPAAPASQSENKPESKPESQQAPKTPQQPALAPEPAAFTPAKASTPPATPSAGTSVHAGPAVRMLARELGVDLALVSGTGPKSRILKEDVQDFVKQSLSQPQQASTGAAIAQPPAIDFSQFGAVEKVAMSKIHKLTAQNMQRSWLNVPHVTQFDEADITELEAFRKAQKADAEQRGTKLTPLPFMLKACAMALRTFPQFNVSLDNDGEHLHQKHYINIGVAVDTPAGLVVPVLRDVDKKSIWQLAKEVIVMGAKAKDKKLMPDDMQGGCFTISSLGSIGGTAFTPIVNTPEVAILGVSKAAMQPHWDGEQFVPRLMMPLSLSYDHRAVNGADAARFTQYLAKVLGDIRYLVM